MSLGTGAVLAAGAGALWGGTGVVLAAVALTLVTGQGANPPVLAGAIAGAAGGVVLMLNDPGTRRRGLLIGSAATVLVAWLALSAVRPFGLPLATAPANQALGVVVVVAGVVFVNRATLWDVRAAGLTRYEIETVLVRVLKGVGFVLFTGFVVLPFYVMIATSLKSQQSLLANPLDLSIDFGQGLGALLRSYVELFRDFNFGRYLLISGIVSVATVVITLLFAVPGAYAVARLRFPGRAVLSRSILLIYMVPAIVLVIPLYAVFSQAGLRDNLIGLLIVYPATTIPVALYMLQGYFRGVPGELEEAGLMDGLSRLGVILKITLPLSLPALASVALYVFMIAWNEFLFAFMFLDDPQIFTLSRGVVSLNSSEVPRQHLMAGAVVATIPVLVIFLWFERFLVQGLTAGSVKG